MLDRINGTSDHNEEEVPELRQLSRLAAAAPSSTFARFRRRVSLLQGARMLAETQINGFWVVLDLLLKRLFRISTVRSDGAIVKDSPTTQSGDTG